MKKLVILTVIIALVGISAVAMFACTDKEDTIYIEKIEITVADNTIINKGDAYDASKFVITAFMSDKSKTKVTNTDGIFYDKSGLKLVNNKYNEAGKVTLKISYLDKHTAEVEFTVNEAI